MFDYSADRYPEALGRRAAFMMLLTPLAGGAQTPSGAVQVPIEEVVVVGTRALVFARVSFEMP